MKKIPKIYFIRHAESTNNILQNKSKDLLDFIKTRSPDPIVSEHGKKQVMLLIFLINCRLNF